jgi:hypothetical protein
MKKLFFCSVISIIGLTGYAQKTAVTDSIFEPKEIIKPSRLDFNVELKTSHLWRGIVISGTMTAMGNIHYALDKKQNLKVGLWGGNGFDGNYKEVDYYIQYQSNGFSIALWDLFNTTGIESPAVFNYDRKTTTHLLDLRTSYQFPKAFPLRIEADFILYGNDRELTSNLDSKNRYSTYVELGYPLLKNEKITLDAYLGAGIALDGNSNLYASDPNRNFDIVNTGIKASKNISIFNYKLPVSAVAMWNPAEKIARIQLGVVLF